MNREAELKAQLRSAHQIMALASANKDGRGIRRMQREITRICRELRQVRTEGQ